MTQPTVESFFSSSKGRTVKFPQIGASVTGTILVVHPPEQQSNPQGELLTWKNGEPRMQVRIEVQTDERDPEIEFDDGSRVLYVKGKMQNAVVDGLRKAGASAPEIGGKLTVTFTGEEPNPGLSPTKLFTVEYVKPAGGAAAGFFNGAATKAPGGVAKPEKISDAAWAAMDESTRQAVANTMADVPPF